MLFTLDSSSNMKNVYHAVHNAMGFSPSIEATASLLSASDNRSVGVSKNSPSTFTTFSGQSFEKNKI